MKLRDTLFLSRANLKGNRHSNLGVVVIALLCISLTVISLLAFTLSKEINEYKDDFRARTIEAYPYNRNFDEKTLDEISEINHVESIDIEDELRVQFFHIENIYDENGTYEEVQNLINEKDTLISAWSLIGKEKRQVIVGKRLDETPEFSCIIPHLFYPFDEDVYETSGLDYIDGESLIGKTITLNEGSEGFNIDFFDGNEAKRVNIPSFQVKLNIVGVYYASVTADGNPSLIYISEDTGKKLLKMAVEHSGRGDDELTDFMNKPEFHNIHITVDNFDNLSEVYNELKQMNIYVVDGTELGINPSTPVISTFFNILSVIITLSTFIISLILILQSSKNVIDNKKVEIGMMKAVGYKNKDIFCLVTLEQIIMTLRGFIIGIGISAIVVTIINLINYNSSYANRIYIINYVDYLVFTFVALAVVVLVPLICEVMFFRKIINIQPREAMN